MRYLLGFECSSTFNNQINGQNYLYASILPLIYYASGSIWSKNLYKCVNIKQSKIFSFILTKTAFIIIIKIQYKYCDILLQFIATVLYFNIF